MIGSTHIRGERRYKSLQYSIVIIGMQIQYCSDLHIDRFPEGTPFHSYVQPIAPILVIAGDICPVSNPLYGQFLQWCRNHWSTILLIAGNHEYFCYPGEIRTFEETDARIRAICTQLNIYFLQAGQSVRLPGTNLRFVGATLWSAIDQAIWSEIIAKKGEYVQTYQRTNNALRLTIPSDINALHALHRAHLFSAIAPQTKKEILIVVTHHIPTMQLLETKYSSERWRSCYASNDDDLFASNISVWICGHGHRATQYKVKNGPLIVMNARGYAQESIRTTDAYNPTASFLLTAAL